MSILSIGFTFDSGTLIFMLLASIAVIAAFFVVEHKSIVYSAFFLGILGMANAALFTLIGYNFIALFFVSVYLGAAVSFIVFSASMFEEAPPVERPIRLITIISVIITAVILIGVFSQFFTGGIQPSYINYRDLAVLLTDKYGFALIIATLTLVTTLIEAITIARTEETE